MSGRNQNKNKNKIQKKVKKIVKQVVKATKTKNNTGGRSRGGHRQYTRELGSYLGKSLLGPSGAALGQEAGAFFGHITGMGAYHVNRNSLLTNTGPPSFSSNGEGCVISHREFLADISSSIAFTNTSYPLNPGMSATFPWLSTVASSFESYEMLGLVFEYKTTSGTAVGSTNTALGAVVMATDYDSYDTAFTSKQQMEAYEFSTSAVPCSSFIHPVECDPRMNVLRNQYIRTGAVSGELHLYDMGNFQIATVGSQAAAVVGELWVSYKVRLLKPKLPTPLNSDQPIWHAREYAIGTSDATHLLGTGTPIVNSGSTMTLSYTTNTVILPVVGRYFVSTCTLATAGTITQACSIAFGANCSGVVVLENGGYSYTRSYTSVNSTSFSVIDVNTTGIGAANTVTFTPAVGITAGNSDVIIIGISSGFNVSVPPSLSGRLECLEQLVRKMGKINLSVEEDSPGIIVEEEEKFPPRRYLPPLRLPRLG